MMLFPRLSLLALVLTYPSAQANDNGSLPSRIKNISRTVELLENLSQYALYHIGLENTTYWYAACGNPRFFGKNCSFVVDTVLFDANSSPDDRSTEPGSSTRKTCEFELTYKSKDSQVVPYMEVLRFGSDKFLVAYVDSNPNSTRQVKHFEDSYQRVGTYIKFIIIHMPNCTMYTSETRGTSSRLTSQPGLMDLKNIFTVYLQEDTFQVAYECTDNVWVQESFNDKGQSLKDIYRVEDSRLNGDSVTMAPGWTQMMPKRGCFDLWPQERYNVLRGSYGDDVPFDLLAEDVMILRSWSTANGNTSICEKPLDFTDSKTWSCKQSEVEAGQPTMFNVTFEYEPQASIVYTMPEGGLLTITSEKRGEDEDMKDIYALKLKRFDVQGKASRSEEFVRVKCDGEPSSLASSYLGHFFRDDVGSFCFSLLRSNGEFSAKCYPEEFFNILSG